MPDTPTTRLGLYKSKSDGSEDVIYTQDIGQNLDKLDAAVGFQAVTSSTRPSSPYSGKAIMETDTSYRTYFSNGTSPASGSWVEIPNSSATYNSSLKLASGKQINIGASTSGAPIAIVAANAGDIILSSRTPTDTSGNSHFYLEADGTMAWGAGGANATDVNLYRSGVNVLTTDDAFAVGGDLTVGTTTWTVYTPTVGNQGTATWSVRTGWYKKIGKIVFVTVYLAASAAGSGTTTLTISLPSVPYRDGAGAATTRQWIGGYGGAIAAGTNSSVSGVINGVVLASGTTAILDQMRGPTDIPMRGEQIGSATVITLQGWYREA